MDYESVIRSFVEPLLEDKDSLVIRQLPSDSEKDVTFLVCADNEDIARLIGKKGSIANAIREVVGVAGKVENKHIHIKFESFGDEEA